jgi:hypothetical protein
MMMMMMMMMMVIVVLLGLIDHEPKTVLCKVQGAVIGCILLVAHLFLHVLQFYLYISACLSLCLMVGN